jgi:competence protein ComEC
MINIVHKVPFLRISVALASGIILGTVIHLDILHLIIILSGLILLLFFLNQHYNYGLSFFFGFLVHMAFVLSGILVFNLYNKKTEFFAEGKFFAIVTEKMVEKPNSFQTLLEIHAFSDNDSVYKMQEKVVALFEKDGNSKSLLPGQAICFEMSPQTIRNNKNPFEFDYKRYLGRQKIFRQVYLPADSWTMSQSGMKYSLRITAERLRMYLLDIYEKNELGEKELSVLSALTLGYKKGLDPEIKRVFSSAGVMHVLAVSGLHTGIVFFMVSFLFGFIKRKRFGRYAFVLIVIALLWSFAYITGLSPSVKRAATMFSFVIIGQNLGRQSNIYNLLAASAFFLLLLNPNNIFDAGFQLSYSAVFGIVFFQPRLKKLLNVENKLLHYFWELLTVSVAAQIATFPFVIFYFNQFPSYFWVSNLVIIPAVTLLIPLGLFMLAFSWLPLVSSIVSYATLFILRHLIVFLEFVESLPASVIKIHFSVSEMFLMAGIMVLLFLFIEVRQKWQFKGILILVLIFIGISAGSKFFQRHKEIIVYNCPQQTIVHLVAGKKNYIISEEKLLQSNMIRTLIENTIVHLRLNSPVYLTCNDDYEDSNILQKNGFLFFHDRLILHNLNKMQNAAPFYPYVNLILADGYKERISICSIDQNLKASIVPLYYLNKNGAYREKLSF